MCKRTKQQRKNWAQDWFGSRHAEFAQRGLLTAYEGHAQWIWFELTKFDAFMKTMHITKQSSNGWNNKYTFSVLQNLLTSMLMNFLFSIKFYTKLITFWNLYRVFALHCTTADQVTWPVIEAQHRTRRLTAQPLHDKTIRLQGNVSLLSKPYETS